MTVQTVLKFKSTSEMTLAFDTETRLITEGCKAPPLVCLSACDGESAELFHHTESREVVETFLESEELLVGHNVAFDFGVIAAKWPDLLPSIFEVYEANRVTDTEIREKLIHIANGVYRRFEKNDGTWQHLEYSLAALSQRHLGLKLEKKGWQ